MRAAVPPPTTVLPSTVTPGAPKLSRAERRRQRRRRERRRNISILGVLGVLAVLAVIVGGVVGVAKHSSSDKPAVPKRTQSTLLFQIRGADGNAAASALLAHDPKTQRGVVLLVPSRVIANIPGHGTAAFGTALALGSPDLSAASLSDLIGVTVDGAMVFDTAAFATFVDRIGGITADVDTDVIRANPRGAAVIVVPAGSAQRLDGTAAVAYATYTAGGSIQQQARLQEVLDGVLGKIDNPDVVTSAVQDLGSGAKVTMPSGQAGTLLAGLAADARANDTDYRVLDVTPVETGGRAAFTLDRVQVQEFVQANLRASIPSGLLSGGNTVLVKNGIGTPQLGESTRAKLNTAGFVYIDGGNVPGFTFRRRDSAVVVYSPSIAAKTRGESIAKALGLPPSAVQFSPQGQSVSDVLVVLGQDYKA